MIRDKEELRVLASDKPADKDAERGEESAAVDIDLSPVRVQVTPAVEWRQMFEETGRVMRDNFWVADMTGNDWAALLARYRPREPMQRQIEPVDFLIFIGRAMLPARGNAYRINYRWRERHGRSLNDFVLARAGRRAPRANAVTALF